MQMYILLNESYEKALVLLRRNRSALVKIVEVLKEKVSVSGDEVRIIVEELGNPNDLTKRKQEKSILLWGLPSAVERVCNSVNSCRNVPTAF